MSEWHEDFAGSTLEQVQRYQAENRAWSKEIRLGVSALVDSRLAKVISQIDYQTDRKRLGDAAAECQRRAALISKQIDNCILQAPVRQVS